MTRLFVQCSKWLSLILCVLLLALFVALGILLFTNKGLNVALWATEKFVPQLKVESTQGALFPRFTLSGVTYSDESLNVDAEVNSLTLAVNTSCLTEPRVCMDELAIDGLTFSMPQLPATSESAQQENVDEDDNITSPIPIIVSRLVLNNINLDILGNQVSWQAFSSGVDFQGNRLRVKRTKWATPYVKLAPSDESTQAAQSQPENTESTPIVLPNIDLPIQIELVRVDVHDFKLDQESPVIVHHLGLSGSARDSKVKVRALELDMPEVKGSLTSSIELKGNYPLTLDLNATVKDSSAPGQTLALKATGSVAKLSLDATLGGLAQAKLLAKLQPLKPELPFDLTLSKGKVQWPLTGKGDYFVAINQLKTHGSLDGYQVDLSTEIKVTDLPDLTLETKGSGDLSHIQLEEVNLATLGGNVVGDVMANWQSPINWAANLTLSHIQPGLQWPDAEGDISGELSTTGQLTEQGGWKVDVSNFNIDGVLREYPLKVVGRLSVADLTGSGELRVKTPQLALSHGPNSINAQGEMDSQWRMDLAVNIPDLIKSVPDLQGRIVGDVALRGELEQPKVGLNIEAKGINWQQEAKVAKVSIQGDIAPLPLPSGNLAIKVTQAQYQETTIDDVSLSFKGSQKQHRLNLDVISDIVSTSLQLTGSMSNDPELAWQGTLQRMQLSSEQGEWRLNQPTALGFEMASQQVSVAAHCWLQAESSLCLEKNIKAGQSGEARLALKQFNFDQIKAFLPSSTELVGQANAKVWAKWSEGVAPQVKANVELSKGKVIEAQPEPIELGWESIKLDAQLAGNKLQANWLFDITDNGDLSGQATIPNVLKQDKQIDGQLKVVNFNLDFLAPVIGELSRLESTINSDIAIKGPILQPKLNGQFVVDDILLKGEISPVEVDSGRVALNFTGYEATMAAAIHTPDGSLEISGDADWRDLQDWKTNVRVFAEELLVSVPPMVRIKAQPDMTISVSPQLATIDGTIALPWGRIVVEELPPSAIGVSRDQVILDAQLKPVESENKVPFTLQSNINIEIGDDFRLSAFGLQGGLVGSLNVAQREQGAFVTGEVNITEGSYRSFGQDLVIEEGKVLMNGPVDQPYLQVTAIRNPDNTQDDVTAGVKVTGPVSDPSVTIFSDPAMPQANALSYLLRGQDIDGETGGNMMTTTLIGLSLAKSGRIVGELGEAFGVQDLQLDTAGSGDESQVTVSGYILPGLKVKYGVGIFDAVGEFTVRYRLMENFYIETVSSVNSAVDLLYQFEFD